MTRPATGHGGHKHSFNQSSQEKVIVKDTKSPSLSSHYALTVSLYSIFLTPNTSSGNPSSSCVFVLPSLVPVVAARLASGIATNNATCTESGVGAAGAIAADVGDVISTGIELGYMKRLGSRRNRPRGGGSEDIVRCAGIVDGAV